MAVDRRDFIKLAGLSALGAATRPAIDARAGESAAHGEDRSKRWAMIIDVKTCLQQKDCTDCMHACHQVHNVPNLPKPEHEIKWIWKELFNNAFPNQHHEYLEDELKGRNILVLCNHCEKPPCVRVCPTRATFKRDDGLVMMDMHRCIGCRFCIAACPYGSRSFNWVDPRGKDANGRPFIEKINRKYPTRMRGVVEKCTFCPERLAGRTRPEADKIPAEEKVPACVAACKYNALLFGDLNDPGSEVRKVLRTRHTIRRMPGLGTRPQVYYVV